MARTKDFDEQEVLAKAMRLFWHKGYNATSMQDLVDGLGISRSSLYDTFGDKRSLYLKALERYRQSAGGKMCAVVSHTASARQGVRQLLEMVTRELLGDEQHKGCFMVNAGVETAPHDAEVNRLIGQQDQMMEDAFYNTILKGQQSGEIGSRRDARALTRFISNVIKGMQVSAKSNTDPSFFEDIIETTMLALD